LSQPKYWHGIEEDLNAHSIEVYALPQDVIRCDAPTVSGDHDVREGGILQFGHSKDDPSRPQIKVMTGALDPLGMPLATDVLSGERADDGVPGVIRGKFSVRERTTKSPSVTRHDYTRKNNTLCL